VPVTLSAVRLISWGLVGELSGKLLWFSKPKNLKRLAMGVVGVQLVVGGGLLMSGVAKTAGAAAAAALPVGKIATVAKGVTK
jgi:hypothetical protein